MKKITYKDSGVDIKAADSFVERIKEKSSLKGLSGFGSLFALNKIIKNYKNPYLVSSTDGVGTKLKIAIDYNIHSTVGIDLVAMNVNDIIVLGAKPLFFLDYIACGKLDVNVLADVVKGIKNGLKQSDCPLIGGETAEMPGFYKKGDYDLAGFCVGVVDKTKVILGDKIKENDIVIGLESSGLHSNGFSLVRKVLGKKGVKKHLKTVLEPTRIYVKPVLSMLSKVKVKGIAHITGGAFYNKATKILPKGLGMEIEKSSWKVPEIFKVIQKEGNIDIDEMYTVLNMGIGMMIIVNKKDVDAVRKQALKYKVKSHVIGKIISGNKKMRLL